MNNDWSEDIELVLQNIRSNAVTLSSEHKKLYFSYKNVLQYFRLPIIVISGINSIVSVGFQEYMKQTDISMTTCVLALVCSIIASIELYLAIQKSMEQSLIASKEFYLLSVDIQKTLLLVRDHRPIPAKEYLEKCYNTYVKLFENSDVLDKKIVDKLTPLNEADNSSPKITRKESNLNLQLSDLSNV
jgi:hypothetical protein